MNNLSRVLTYLLIALILFGIFALIKKSNAKELQKSQYDDHVIVHMPKIFVWIGIFAVAFFTAIVIFMSLIPNDTASAWVYAGFLFFVLLGAVLIIIGTVWKIDLYKDQDYLLYTSSAGRSYTILYADITGYKVGMNTITLKVGKKAFYIDKQAANLVVLMQMFNRHNVRHK